ncbi:SHOCT domain-containing protein [Streptomyces sp. t39]|uniref:SHOCT domain-containing protein n=1 Tax=Streptomyces sp. t39 TaxID=1828156 RepID=UPI0011CE94B0|nr:SHOCT domain-containing protein [Streptomyces sp. t39]TXS57535.1 SHOCT domain-containing protein [Streptomyces sp. t39]
MSTNLAYDFPLLSMFWTMLWFFLWIMWFILLIRIIGDIFRDDGLSGWGKTGWLIFVVVLPFLGVFVYVIARGKGMGAREAAHVSARQKAFDDYVRETAGGKAAGSSVDELARLAEIRNRGDISEEEFRRAKELVLGGQTPTTASKATGTGTGATRG